MDILGKLKLNRLFKKARRQSSPAIAPVDHQLGEFVKSLGAIAFELTSLEVNTILVDDIEAESFIPSLAYGTLYRLSKPWLVAARIDPTLHHQYLQLRYQLEMVYGALQQNPQSEFYDQAVQINPEAIQDLIHHSDDFSSPLPDPEDLQHQEQCQQLLTNFAFLCGLRKLYELKTTLDLRDRRLKETDSSAQIPPHNLLYAQTVVQLNGQILNRYDQDLLKHPQESLLLKLHQQAVTAGEQQWRDLLRFLVGMITDIVKQKP